MLVQMTWWLGEVVVKTMDGRVTGVRGLFRCQGRLVSGEGVGC